MIDYPRLILAARMSVASIVVGYFNAEATRLQPIVNGTNAEPFTLDVPSLKASLVTLNAPQVVRDAVEAGAGLLSYRYTFLDTVELPVGLDPAVLDALVTAKVAAATAGINLALAQKMDKSVYDNDGNNIVDVADVKKFSFATAATVWTMSHNLNRNPEVRLFDSAGNRIYTTVTYPNNNTAQATFSVPKSGHAEI